MCYIRFQGLEGEMTSEQAITIHNALIKLLDELGIEDVPVGFVEVIEEEAHDGQEGEASE